jgi:hypothetical protein
MGELIKTESITPAEAERLSLLQSACGGVFGACANILGEGYSYRSRRLLARRLGQLSAAAQLLEEHLDVNAFTIAASSIQRKLAIKRKLRAVDGPRSQEAQYSLFGEGTA